MAIPLLRTEDDKVAFWFFSLMLAYSDGRPGQNLHVEHSGITTERLLVELWESGHKAQRPALDRPAEPIPAQSAPLLISDGQDKDDDGGHDDAGQGQGEADAGGEGGPCK